MPSETRKKGFRRYSFACEADAKPAPAAGYAETVSDGICIGIIKSGQGERSPRQYK
ncbi:hypothetical protein [Neisseria meningitidis]|uniref:hypothetical protein n=1 Tax=Neisseria meningitidis TaxID=487 RepID=UPI00163E793D|nr:hypothetical protein [Neisseria meningitidis]